MFDQGDPTAMISTRTHGMIDYAASTAALVMPHVMGFGPNTTTLLNAHAVSATGMSMLTDYEAGLSRVIPMEGHLAMDVACGIGMLLAAGTVLRGERGAGFVAMMGVAEILTAVMTEKPMLEGGAGSFTDRLASSGQSEWMGAPDTSYADADREMATAW